MQYLSTRGQIKDLSFKEAVMMGLADDGGLLLPDHIPLIPPDELDSLTELTYPELAFNILQRFIDDIPASRLRELIQRSYASFTVPEVTPVVKKGNLYILELFHGPTLAFKDVALQFLGNLFELILSERKERMNIVGATSGDTGSAAIYGVRGKENINIFIMHPEGRVSPIQEKQMTTVLDANVFNLAIRGSFDDGQNIVKEIFNDLPFKNEHALGAVNSINWARVLAQVVYYFYAWGQVRKNSNCHDVYFSVPTGNFGDIFAGYIAKEMGLPIRRLILATNANNILSRFVRDGDYSIGEVVQTWSPSMDIQISSNFERYLYYLHNGDTAAVNAAMATFKESGRLSFTDAQRARIAGDFLTCSVTNDETLATIRDFYQATGYCLDPHTAIGVKAAQSCAEAPIPIICLATAHPAKFGEAVRQAIGSDPQRPPCLVGIEEQPSRCETVDAETDVIKAFVKAHAR
ncbi:MAG: threonine synthase [Desulfuromonadales bacterium]|nr:threonine synthase [Desulfuromonadales bacterium]